MSTTMPELRQQLLEQALLLVPFEGWSVSALDRAAVRLAMDSEMARIAFPNGPDDAITLHNHLADQAMSEHMAGLDTCQRVPDRIQAGIMARLHWLVPHRESVRRGILFYLRTPVRMPSALRQIYHTVDEIWFAAGDRSADWSHYSRRATLAGIYLSTLAVWLNDTDPELAPTRQYLARRLSDVARLGRGLRHWRNTGSGKGGVVGRAVLTNLFRAATSCRRQLRTPRQEV